MRKPILLLLAASVGILPLVWTTGCAVASKRETMGQYTDDKAISARVKTALIRDPVVKASQVNVTTFKGVVQLSGFVDSAAAKDRAGEIARGTRGVVQVRNDLILPTGR